MKFKLKKGDKIGFFSPSSPVTAISPERFMRAKKYLEDKDFILVEGSRTGKQDFYRSGTIQERVEELNSLIRDPEIKCIISTIGGLNSNSLLPYIDYEAFKKNPKIIIGYSDVTAILLGIYAKTGITTFYGPALVASFGELPPYVDETFSCFDDIFIKNLKLPYTYKNPEFWTDEMIKWEEQDCSKTPVKNELITLEEGKATGRVIGGNLMTIGGFWGSPYMPDIREGDILFIEDSLKTAGIVERNYAFLKVNGVFSKVAGVIIGKHEKFDDLGTGRKHYEIFQEVIGKLNIPVLAEFDCCHTHPMLTLPIGATIELDATNKKVTLIDF
ncbi:S66 family peptidase [Candidatus Cetobacterium colombiensis]|jgi:muramoyltetrapeptide carboxypeptidase LdcA involved in peptidoglycan recycling|uniref:LD-carboxypeptidase n=1 Tax=Candidatus Cetobacterium colombiensis TaxID=3073100 RepID=A0ABU4WCS9_9FUSO|nr:LD-carboxypeptidase [Candidatus Cetobacterium colombiensis]MDX8337332.1 LD-carboxypeptidase [Candidatus Cetobacterium colombiensis]